MAKEAYVSFKVARLLKDKGFGIEEETRGYYPIKGDADGRLMFGAEYHHNTSQVQISAPTHQMAMAWLREKGIHMSIDTVISSKGSIYFNIDTYSEDSGWNHPVDFYNSYEEAVEVALKYSLENLI